MDKQALLERLLHRDGLGIGRLARDAKRHLRDQIPRLGDVPGGLDFGVDERVVVLQVGAEPFVGQSGPDDVLVDGARVLGPDGEVVLGEGELVLQLARVFGVFEEQDGAVGVAEAVEALLGVAFEVLGRGDGLDDFGDDVPELVVVVFEEEDEAGRVGAEGRGSLLEGCFEDLFDLGVWDAGFGGQGVV